MSDETTTNETEPEATVDDRAGASAGNEAGGDADETKEG